MAAEIKAPALRELPDVPPAIRPGAMAESRPYVASEKMNEAIGFPGKVDEDWQVVHDKAIAHMGSLLKRYRSLKVYDACVHCGSCRQVPYFSVPATEEHAGGAPGPDARRRYSRWPGRSPRSSSARATSREVLDSGTPTTTSARNAGAARCSARTASTPPDHDGGREILDAVATGRRLERDHRQGHRIGNNLGLPGPAPPTLEGLEGVRKRPADVRYPLDQRRRVLLITPSADFFAEPHVGSLISYGKVFHAAGIAGRCRRTPPRPFRPVHRQLRAAARHRDAHPRGGARARRQADHRRRVRTRVARRLQFLEHAGRHRRRREGPVRGAAAKPARHALPAADAHLRFHLGPDPARRAHADKEANDHRVVTFHDSCNVARRGWATRRAGSSRYRARSSARRSAGSTKWRPARRTSRPSAAAAAAAHRRAARPAGQGCPAPDDRSIASSRSTASGQASASAGAVHESAAVLRLQDGNGGRRAPAGEHRDPARREILTRHPITASENTDNVDER